jgi:hypothetical protein
MVISPAARVSFQSDYNAFSFSKIPPLRKEELPYFRVFKNKYKGDYEEL